MSEERKYDDVLPEDALPNDALPDDAPLFKKWSYWYALVIGFLVILVVFFYLLTKHFE
jgi:hypothetical protein